MNCLHFIHYFSFLSEKKYSNWIAILNTLGYTILDETVRCTSKWFILAFKTWNIELDNPKCVTYAQPIPLSLRIKLILGFTISVNLTKRECVWCVVQWRKRNIFRGGGQQSHFSQFFPSVKCFFPLDFLVEICNLLTQNKI